jgi:hypothetical protein
MCNMADGGACQRKGIGIELITDAQNKRGNLDRKTGSMLLVIPESAKTQRRGETSRR